MTESGHRCAVCGDPCPLERAHIIPWRKSNNHNKENLICLCANCHQRADLEKWGEKVLKIYKNKPWVLRKNEPLQTTDPIDRITITLDIEYDEFNESNKRLFLHALAGFLEISPEKIRFKSIKKGSIKAALELPNSLVIKLLNLDKSSFQQLEKEVSPLKILSIEKTAKFSESEFCQKEKSLLEKTHDDINIGVIGLGYVGLPIALKFAEVGFNVFGFDVNKNNVDALNKGISLIPSIKDSKIKRTLIDKKRFIPLLIDRKYENNTKSIKDILQKCDVYISCVPTPLNKVGRDYSPDLHFQDMVFNIIKDAVECSTVEKERLILMESSVVPGSTQSLFNSYFGEKYDNVYIAYSPEQIGKDCLNDVDDVIKIIGADHESLVRAKSIYKYIFYDNLFTVNSLLKAETIKCAENTYKFLSISLANEIATNFKSDIVKTWELMESIHKKQYSYLKDLLHSILESKNQSNIFDIILDSDKDLVDFIPSKVFSIKNDTKKILSEIEKYDIYDSTAIEFIENKIIILFKKMAIHYFHQLFIFCGYANMDYYQIIKGILTKKYGMELVSHLGPGVGGHCIPVDPLYLYHAAKMRGMDITVIKEAFDINNECPSKVIDLIKESIPKDRKLNYDSINILLLGISQTSRIAELQESPARQIVEHLTSRNPGKTYYYEPDIIRRRSKKKNIIKKLSIPSGLRNYSEDISERTKSLFDFEWPILMDIDPAGEWARKIDLIVSLKEYNEFYRECIYFSIISKNNFAFNNI